MVTAADVLERHFAGLTPDEVDSELTVVPTPGAGPLSVDARSYLIAHGGDAAVTTLADIDPEQIHRERTLVAAQALSEVLRCTADINEAARLLGVSRSRISHRIADGSLYAFTVGRRRRIPRWQITDDGSILPGLGDIVPAIPSQVHPLTLQSLMTSPNSELDRLAPVDYLRSGGSAKIIATLIAGLGR